MDEQTIRGELRQWIASRSKTNSRGGLDDNTKILDDGIISSLDIVELVLFIESLKGDEIDAEDLEPEVFQSVDALYRGFFAQKSA